MADHYLNTNPWQTNDADFPRSGTVQDQLAFCLNYAVLAPSIHNTQPWSFRLVDDVVEVCLDRTRALPVTDPFGREMTISGGAALMNLNIALNHFGYESWVQYAPEPNTPDLIARVRVGRSRVPGHQDEALFRSIRRRRTVRRPFQARPVPRELQRRMIWIAMEHGAWLHFADSPADRASIRGLIEQAHEIKGRDNAYQAERSRHLELIDPVRGDRPPVIAAQNGDGSSNATDEAGSPELLPGQDWIARERGLLDSSPVLVVLGSNTDSPEEWVRSGQALQHILLHATSVGLSASFLNQPCQIPELREQLREMTGRSGPPQLLLRMGYARSANPTPRRAVGEVIDMPSFV
jgi:hypothetical protein